MVHTVIAHTSLGDKLQFSSMHGQEGLSELFEFEVHFISPSQHLDIKAVLGQPMTLEIDVQESEEKRYLNGQIVRFGLVGHTGTTERFYTWRATVRPWLWFLTQTRNSRIFQNKTTPQIIEEVLGTYGFPFKKYLTGNYRVREYCVQYQESDYDYICRLMEDEGIYYYFIHQNGSHTLMMVDDIIGHEKLPGFETVPYIEPTGTVTPMKPHINSWMVAGEVTPGAFVTTDYDYNKSQVPLQKLRKNPVKHVHAAYEIFEWQGGYSETEHADEYGKIRLQALQAKQERIEAHSNLRALAPGYTFKLRNHMRDSENRDYLILQARYFMQESNFTDAEGNNEYHIDMLVQPSDIPFRAPHTIEWPRTHGPQTAVVTGPAGEEIWTDKLGRIKVKFHWDRYSAKDENSSCWIRVSSAWAGSGFGAVQIPRVGDEVVVDFIGGDPDCPLIIGRVYNDRKMPPWNLPEAATQMGFMSRSKTGDGTMANVMRFEDKKGEEELFMQAQKDMNTNVKNNESHSVGGDRSKNVTGNESVGVQGNRTETVQGNESVTIQQNRDVTINQNDTLTVKQNLTETVDLNRTITVHQNNTHTTDLNDELTVGVDRKVTIGGTNTIDITGTSTTTVSGFVSETLKSGRTTTITGKDKRSVTGEVDDTNTGYRGVKTTGDSSYKATGSHLLYSDGDMTIGTDTQITMGATSKISMGVAGSSTIHATPGTMDVKVGETSGVSITPGKVTIMAGGSEIVIEASGVSVNGSKINLNA